MFFGDLPRALGTGGRFGGGGQMPGVWPGVPVMMGVPHASRQLSAVIHQPARARGRIGRATWRDSMTCRME